MKMVKLKPTDKKIMVRDPITREPLKTGEKKPLNTYWLRRLRDKSVCEMTATTGGEQS